MLHNSEAIVQLHGVGVDVSHVSGVSIGGKIVSLSDFNSILGLKGPMPIIVGKVRSIKTK
ncbi:hypothetical protein GALL_536890 [mine drainage metagenome]|uniref:Uncharacterized protein n=1 Tax=mine drainage metagenome TaxID=410659 RepID=A0A1J5PAC0_9ZZZZ